MAVEYSKSLPFNLPVNRDTLTYVRRTNSKAGLDAFLRISRNLHNSTIDDFDAHPYLLNFQNGTLDLRTGILTDHDRDDKITRIVDCNYVHGSECRFFSTFLETIQPDTEMRAYIQRVIGYSLLGIVRERAFFVFHGPGNNGKSAFTNLFLALLGDYACAATAGLIMTGRRGSSPSNDIARLRGKRLVIVPETSEDGRIDSALIKSLSGGDIVTARPLYREFQDFKFSGKIVIVTNHLPAVTDNSKGFWDRVKLAPFAEDIAHDKIIKLDELMARLRSEHEGIIAWAVDGCRQYQLNDDLGIPGRITSEIGAYRNQEDVVKMFLSDYCEIEPHYSVYKGPLYSAFAHFCYKIGRGDTINPTRFTRELRSLGFSDGRDHDGRKWFGLKLLDNH